MCCALHLNLVIEILKSQQYQRLRATVLRQVARIVHYTRIFVQFESVFFIKNEK